MAAGRWTGRSPCCRSNVLKRITRRLFPTPAAVQAAVDQAAVDAYVERQMRFDPDVWVLEFDAPDFVPPFEVKLV